MDPYDLVKKASEFARQKKFNEAIDVLITLYESGEVSLSKDFIKVIPYFQKAGRYEEVESFCVEFLMPKVAEWYRKTYKPIGRCDDIIKALTNNTFSQVYDKLALCAKREKRKEDERIFSQASIIFYSKFDYHNEIGTRIELASTILRSRAHLGHDLKCWPEYYKAMYIKLINNTYGNQDFSTWPSDITGIYYELST